MRQPCKKKGVMCRTTLYRGIPVAVALGHEVLEARPEGDLGPESLASHLAVVADDEVRVVLLERRQGLVVDFGGPFRLCSIHLPGVCWGSLAFKDLKA